MTAFGEAYAKLNPEQKKAVDTIDGPVMVIAGPGTGKTQVLALRIANILTKTDTAPDSVLCLTFTNAGVRAMRERLLQIIGSTATRVRIATFHSFAMQVLEKFFANLDLPTVPLLIEDATSVTLLDEIFYARDWGYLRPRAHPSLYYRDLKSLITLLKRERLTPQMFRDSVQKEITAITEDPENISTRGETKGQLKKEVEKRIESLKRSLEVADFYEIYERIKRERNYIDYADVLEYLVRLVEESDEVRDWLREQFLYVLVDEHQDSTGIQNEFLEKTWRGTEQPNIFVVGDDRQLIYGFGGASLAYFESFKHTFGRATLITLTSNYRSTQVILETAEALLTSTLAEGKLISHTSEAHPVQLIAADYPRDEIIAAGLAIKAHIANGGSVDDCALLMPKNRQVKAATYILRDMGLPVAAENTLKLFEQPGTDFLLSILTIINNPHDATVLSRTILHPLSGVPLLEGHEFLHSNDLRVLALSTLLSSELESIAMWGTKLSHWLSESQSTDVYGLIQIIGSDILLERAIDNETIRINVEIIRTLLNLVSAHVERGERVTLESFLQFINRMKEYEEDMPLAIFAADRGVKVLTLHASKGLEFDFVWIAHLDEKSLMGSRRQAFALPVVISEKIEERDEEVAKRQLYVAMTRAKRHLNLSYARFSHAGVDQTIANIIASLPDTLFTRQSASVTEAMILESNPKHYVLKAPPVPPDDLSVLTEIVAKEYTERSVSVTLLNNFFECPWKWYFRNLLQLPEPLSESLHVGNVVHKTIEFILKKQKMPTQKNIDEYIASCAALEARHEPLLTKRLISQTITIISTWRTHHYEKLQQPYQVERSLSYRDPSFPELSLYGKIDVLEECSPGSVRVTDWKTGGGKTKAEIERIDEEGRMSAYLRQLTMYQYLIEGSSHGQTSVMEARLVFVEGGTEKNSIVSRAITSEDVERLRQDIKDYKRFVETGVWTHRKCSVKTYGEDDLCEYCALAERSGAKIN